MTRMTTETWLLFLGAGILLSMTPGPNSLLAITHGGLYGTRRTLNTILGGILGFSLIIAVSMSGLGVILAASGHWFSLVKWAGALYLIYLGIITWRAAPLHEQLSVEIDSRFRPSSSLFREGFLVAIANPKVLIFFTAFLPQFIDPEQSLFIQFVVMTLTFMSIECLFELLLASCSSKVVPWFSRDERGRWFQRITGSAFVGAGVVLASVSRS